MEYKRVNNHVIMRLDPGDEVLSSLLTIGENEQVNSGVVSGIGATDDFTIGIFDVNKQDYCSHSYTGTHEITSISGNLTTMNGKSYSHIHIACAGTDGKIIGGHLLNCRISLTAEIFIDIIDERIERRRNMDMGINVLSFM